MIGQLSSSAADGHGEVHLRYQVPTDLPGGAYSLTFFDDGSGGKHRPASSTGRHGTAGHEAEGEIGGGAVVVVEVPNVGVLPFEVD